MALVIRGNRAYEYRSVRRGGRATSEYLGGGMSAECARYFQREAEAERRDLAAKRAEWEAERARLDEADQHAANLDAAYDRLATVALLATGHHRPQRGRWRRRRTMAQISKAKPAGPAPTTRAEMVALLDRLDAEAADQGRGGTPRNVPDEVYSNVVLPLVAAAEEGDERAMPALRVLMDRRPALITCRPLGEVAIQDAAATSAGGDLLNREGPIREMQAIRDELAGPGAGPLERLLAERVALSWFDATRLDITASRLELEGTTFAKSEYLSRQRSRSHARFLAAVKSLATVRRLAMPELHIHQDEATPRPGSAVPATPDRLRLVSHDPGVKRTIP